MGVVKTKTFNVSLDLKGTTAQRDEWEVVEGDNGNILIVTLTDNGTPVDLTGCHVFAVFGLPDGRTVEQDTEEGSVTIGGADNNVITINLKTGSFAPGKGGVGLMKAEIEIYSGDDYDTRVTTAQFTFQCRRAIMNDDTVEASDDYPILVTLISQCESAISDLSADWDAYLAARHPDWNEADPDSPKYIANKPSIPTATQTDWNEADNTSPAYLKNKPNSFNPSSHNHGRIDSNGRMGSTYEHDGGDWLVLADYSDSGRVIRSDIRLGVDTSKWLRNDGSWTAPTYTDVGAMAAGATPTPAAHESTHEIGGTDALPAASTSKAGLVQLYDGVDSSSTTLAATAAAVKLAYEHGGGGGGVQSDWDEADNTDPAYIKNKPTIPASPVQSDWNEADNTSLAYIANKPTIPAAQVQSDWSEADNTKVDYIKNKPASMTPTAHASTHATGGTDAISPADIGAMAANATPTPAAHASSHAIGGTDALSAASTSTAGLVQLYDGVDSTSTTLAATANAVKLAYDHGGGGGATLLQVTASAVSSLPTTINDANITANMVVVQYTLSAPQTQSGDWTVTTSAGSLTISGNMASISTDIELILAEV